MCDPITAGLAALQGIQTISGINAQNDASAANSAQALVAMNEENTDSTNQYIEQQRSLIQGGFDAVLEGRSAESVAYTSAIENGIQGASVKALLRDKKQTTARSSVRTSQEMESLSTQQGANFRHITSKAQGRINSVAPTSFTLGDAAGILTPIVKSQME